MLRRVVFTLTILLFACTISSFAQSLITDIPVPGNPSGVAANPATNRIYVSLYTSTGTAVAVIDGSTNTVLTTIPTQEAFVIAADTVTNRVYTAGCNYIVQPLVCGVTVIDGSSNSVIATIPIDASNGIGLQGIAVNPVTNRIYVADASNFFIDVIDGSTNKIIAKVSTDRTQALGLAVDFGTNQLAITINGNALWVMSGATNQIVQKITVGSENANTAVNSFSSQAFVTNELFQPSTLAIVSLRTGKVENNIQIGNTPFGVAVDLFTNIVFVTDKGDGTVAVVDGTTKKKIATVNVANPDFVDVNPVSRMAYVTDSNDELVHVISE